MNVEARLHELERRMDASDHERVSMLAILNRNEALIAKVADDTQELRELWSEARSAFRLFTRLMAFGRWLVKFVVLPLAFLLAAVYAWTHEGRPPAWLHSLTKLEQ